jgi:hypothetical protein
MRKKLAQAIVFVFLAPAGLARPTNATQSPMPTEVRGDQVLTQINDLFLWDDVNKRPAEETLSYAKLIIGLNNLQIDYVDLTTDNPQTPMEAAESKNNGTFFELRTTICKARPMLKLITLEGKLKSCQ